jgi:hypothetical protein
MPLAPAQVAALGMAAIGIGLIAAAFIGESLGAVRMGLGLTLVIAALITAGLQALNSHGASPSTQEES